MSLGSVSLRSGQILVGHSNSEPWVGLSEILLFSEKSPVDFYGTVFKLEFFLECVCCCGWGEGFVLFFRFYFGWSFEWCLFLFGGFGVSLLFFNSEVFEEVIWTIEVQ